MNAARRSAVVARDVVRSYGAFRALDGFSLAIAEGETFGLLGPNGSGKSTFLMLLAGGEEPDSGSLDIDGLEGGRATRAATGVVFQENTSDPLMTPLETVVFAGRLNGLSRSESAQRGRTLLSVVGLGDRMQARNATLSGGMRRRVELARALVHRPSILLLDEPTTGVDPGERAAFWDALRTSDLAGSTVILATNDLAEADSVCDRVAFLANGRVVTAGTPLEMKRGLGRETIRLTAPGITELEVGALAGVEGVESVAVGENEIRVSTADASSLAPALFTALAGRVRTLSIEPTTLADAYFASVGAGRPNVEDREDVL